MNQTGQFEIGVESAIIRNQKAVFEYQVKNGITMVKGPNGWEKCEIPDGAKIL